MGIQPQSRSDQRLIFDAHTVRAPADAILSLNLFTPSSSDVLMIKPYYKMADYFVGSSSLNGRVCADNVLMSFRTY